MTVCNVKGVPKNDRTIEKYHFTLHFHSLSMSFTVFQLIVLVFWSTNLLFWFTLTTPIVSFSDSAGRFLQQKQLYTTCSAIPMFCQGNWCMLPTHKVSFCVYMTRAWLSTTTNVNPSMSNDLSAHRDLCKEGDWGGWIKQTRTVIQEIRV